eukprot:255586-Amphidinium_carterae.2
MMSRQREDDEDEEGEQMEVSPQFQGSALRGCFERRSPLRTHVAYLQRLCGGQNLGAPGGRQP